MKKYIKVLGYAVLAALFATSLSGCTKKPTGGGNVIVWSFEEADTWKPIIKDFEKNNKGYKLVYKKQTLDSEYEKRVLNSILSGAGPDVWSMPNDWVYRHKEKLFPLPEDKAKNINLDKQFVPAIKQSVTINDKIYALSPSAEPLMVYYNTKLFNEAERRFSEENRGDNESIKLANNLLREVPKTWTDFVAATNLITQKDGEEISVSGAAIGTSTIHNAEDILYLLMLQSGTKIVSDDIKIASFNLPAEKATNEPNTPGRNALEFYSSFADPSAENYSWNESMGDEIDAFANSKVAMIFGYSSLQNTLLQKYPEFRYKKAFMPQLEQDADKIVDYARFNSFGVSRESKNPSAAWNIVLTLTGKPGDDFSSANRVYTSKKANSYDISMKNREGSNPEKLSLATAQTVIKGRYPAEFNALIKEAIAAVNSGNLDAQSALDLSANKITELLRREDW